MSSHHRHGAVSYVETHALTTRHLKDVARKYLAHLEQRLQTKPQAFMELWAHVVSPSYVNMTRAVRFDEGVLYVQVSNSSLLSVLHGASEKKKLIEALQAKVPDVLIRDISFRMGSLK